MSYTAASRWFARCRWISPDGKVLVMERTRPAARSEFPARLPGFLTDLKRTNYGMAPSQRANGAPGREWFVCHDYGTNLLRTNGLRARLRRADWISDE